LWTGETFDACDEFKARFRSMRGCGGVWTDRRELQPAERRMWKFAEVDGGGAVMRRDFFESDGESAVRDRYVDDAKLETAAERALFVASECKE